MIAAARESADLRLSAHAGLEHLLLGDLRELLDEPASPTNSRWLLAILDKLLVGRPRTHHGPSQPGPNDHGLRWHDGSPQRGDDRSGLFAKLRRLRDRVAHQAPWALLGNEIRCDLRDLMEG
jgi:hypothetical protein